MAKYQSGAKRTTFVRKAPGSIPNPVIKTLFVEAATWLEQNELAKAEQVLDQHLALAPHSWPGLCLKAMLAAQTKRYALAEQIWCALLKSRPVYADGHCQLGLVCETTGRLGEAQGFFQRALALDPASRTAHAGLGAVYHNKVCTTRPCNPIARRSKSTRRMRKRSLVWVRCSSNGRHRRRRGRLPAGAGP
jgi:tetratricopeptide (TPR) repeat protein